MTRSPLKKYILTPAVLSASIFGALTLPLAILGSQPVTIQLQDEPVFHGQLRDAATPYLGLASIVSLGAGLASVAVTGWQQSTRKSSQVEAQLSELSQNLQEKEAQLECIKLSEARLEAFGLSGFIKEDVPLQQVLKTLEESPQKQTLKVPEVSQNVQQVVEPLVITTQNFEAQPVVPPQMTVQAAAAKFASAQMFLGYSQAKATVKPSPQKSDLAPSEVEELHTQLQQIMAQMASLQTTLSTTRSTVPSEAHVPVQAQLQVVQSWSVHQMAS